VENCLARLVKGKFPVTQGQLLAIPKRHASDYVDFGTVEVRACQHLHLFQNAKVTPESSRRRSSRNRGPGGLPAREGAYSEAESLMIQKLARRVALEARDATLALMP
jgi:hypothetical protein